MIWIGEKNILTNVLWFEWCGSTTILFTKPTWACWAGGFSAQFAVKCISQSWFHWISIWKRLRHYDSLSHTPIEKKTNMGPQRIGWFVYVLTFSKWPFFSGSKVKVFQGKKPPTAQQQRKFHPPRHLGSMASGLIGPATSAICSKALWWPRKAAAYL